MLWQRLVHDLRTLSQALLHVVAVDQQSTLAYIPIRMVNTVSNIRTMFKTSTD